ncbi:MAG TPA: thiamine phosphate synthase [Acidimicrobiia bacterium]
MTLGRLHVVTDTRPGREPLRTVAAALDAGAPVVQVRAKAWTDADVYELACRVADLCAAHGATCVVNDRPDVAVAVDAAGAHVGEDDLPVAAARRVLGPFRVLGATAREPTTALAHEAAGASYLGVGPAYATTTKAGLPAALGPDGVGAVAAAVTIPVVAVAAVTTERVAPLLEAGAYGVAVISAVSDAADPARATEALLRAIDAAAPR